MFLECQTVYNSESATDRMTVDFLIQKVGLLERFGDILNSLWCTWKEA